MRVLEGVINTGFIRAAFKLGLRARGCIGFRVRDRRVFGFFAGFAAWAVRERGCEFGKAYSEEGTKTMIL